MGKWKPNPSLKKALSRGPQEFAIVVPSLIERYGDEAKKLIYDTILQMATEQGAERGAQAKDINDLLEFERLACEDFGDEGLNSPGYDDPARTWVVKSKKKVVTNLSKCGGCETGIPEIWQDMGFNAETIRMFGEIYCHPWDLGTRIGFNPKMKFKFNKLVTEGDAYCEFCEWLEE